MDTFFWIIDLLIPTAMTIIGVLFKTHPPQKINMIYGYRTTRSMASQEAWDYAHQLCGKEWIVIGLILLAFVILIKLIAPTSPEILSLINTGVSITVLILPIPFIEKILKDKFGK